MSGRSRTTRALVAAALASLLPAALACERVAPKAAAPPRAEDPALAAQLQKLQAEDQRRRDKAAELGLARADSAEMEHVDAFLCGKLLAALTGAKKPEERRAASDEVSAWGCRQRREWAEHLTGRAREMGMTDVEGASLRTLQAYVCDQLAAAASAARPQDKAALSSESEIYGCRQAGR